MLSGNLDDVSILELLQLVAKTKSTGVLLVKGKGVTGRIFINRGAVINAEFGKVEGFDALKSIALIQKGFFTFEKASRNVERKVDMPTEKIILELNEVIQTFNKEIKSGITINSIPVLNTDAKIKEFSISGDAIRIISEIDGKKSIKDIADSLNKPYFDVANTIANLIKQSLIKITGEKQLSKIKPVQLTVGMIRNILSGEDGTWMSHLLGMAPKSLLDEFENEFVVWIDVELVSKWENEIGERITSIIATTKKYDELILQISPQISLEDNIVFHEKLAKKFDLKEGDKIEVVPNI